jgi:hypothetical protein
LTRTRFLVGLALVGTIAGCSPASGSPAPSAIASEPVAASADAGLAECQPLDLVLPSGELLDLTGSWEGNDLGPYQLRQFGDCLWWVGQNATFMMLFFGQLDPDFTVTGNWATAAASDHVIGGIRNPADLYIGTGTMSLRIEVAGGGTNADVTLTKVAETDSEDFAAAFPVDVTTWVRVDDTPDHPVPGP